MAKGWFRKFGAFHVKKNIDRCIGVTWNSSWVRFNWFSYSLSARRKYKPEPEEDT